MINIFNRADPRRSADSHVRAMSSRDSEVLADMAVRAPFVNFLNRPCISNNTAGRTILTKAKAVIFGSVIVGALALPLIMQAGQPPKEHSRYKLIDLGTFGGPSSQFYQYGKNVNNRGAVVGGADTANPDPFAPNCAVPSCFVQHAV